MALRLIAALEHGPVRHSLFRPTMLLGSAAECDICLVHPTISRQHARLTIDGSVVTIEDLGSSNGTIVSARRITRAEVAPGTPLYFGRVAAHIEEMPDADLEVGIALPIESAAAPQGRETATVPLRPVGAFTLDHLPGLLERALRGDDPATLARAAGEALFTAAPCVRVDVEGPGGGVLFSASADIDATNGTDVRRQYRDVTVTVRFVSDALAHAYGTLVDIALLTIALARRPAVAARPSVRIESKSTEAASLVPGVRRIYDDAARVAQGAVSVLITGESGTGKEVLARFIHRSSAAARGAFVAINCAALPNDLLEAELFGVERGVATGVEPRPGKFELADNGTLFLDEVGDMAPSTQAKILRVLQEREVFRLGGRDPRPARTRVIAATNRPMAALLADGRFREDLYHRIATWVVDLPPLRERRADIPALATYFLRREAAKLERSVGGITRAALEALVAYRWPGNIRQLENEISRAVLFLDDGEMLDTARLNPTIAAGAQQIGGTLERVLAAVERDEIQSAIRAASGDIAAACARLGISRATLYRRLKALGIDEPADA